MSENTPIIDVAPLEHSSSRIRFDREARRADQNRTSSEQATSWPGFDSEQSRGQAHPSTDASAWSPGSALGGLAQMAIGAGLIAIGVPMLILPGPGLLSIGAGALLVARGFSKLIGR